MLAGSNRGCLDNLLLFMARRLLGMIRLGGQFPTEADVSLVQRKQESLFIWVEAPDCFPRIARRAVLEQLSFSSPRSERLPQTFSQQQSPFARRLLPQRFLCG